MFSIALSPNSGGKDQPAVLRHAQPVFPAGVEDDHP
jgi:hypothetical protein